jgi:hypothetical protein
VDKRVQGCLVGARCVGGRAHQCLPATVEDEEPDEAVPKGCSPEHERR